jgi:hypothetical protein
LPPKQVQVSYIKSTVSTVLHADGVFGGPTPHGLLYMAFFSEHAKIPDTTQYAVDEVAKTFKPVTQPNREPGWVREVGGEVIMSLQFARSFRDWLNNQITILEHPRPESPLTLVEDQQQS